MACDLTSGRLRACFDVVAGIKAVYFANFGSLGVVTYDVTDTDTIDAFGDAPEFFKYELRGNNNSYTSTITKDVSNGTSFYAQSLAVNLPKLDKATHKELKLLVYGSPHVVVEDYNGNQFVMGLENGADVTGGTIVTGAAKGDFNGYTLTLTAEEKLPANFLVSDIVGAGGTVATTNIEP